MTRRLLHFGRLGSLARRETNSLWILAERVASNLLNFIAIIAIMRLLGPSAYGQWAFAISIISVLLVTGHLGLDGLLMRKLVDQPERARHLLGVTASLKFAIYIPAVCITLAFFTFKAEIDAVERSLLYVLIVAVLVAPLTSSLVAWCNAHSQFRSAARARIAAVVAGFVGKIALIAGGLGIVPVGIAHSSMFLLEAVILLFVVRLHGGPSPWQWRFDQATVRELLSQSLYLFAATIFAILFFNVDVIVLRAYSSSYEVGLYALVPQVILASQMLPYAITLSRFPDLARSASDTDGRAHFYDAVTRVLKSLMALSALAMAGLAMFIVVAFDFVFGPDYAATKPILWLAVLVLPPLFVRQLTAKIYILTGEGRRLALIELGGLAVALAILILGVPHYGAVAAIMAVITGCWITVLVSLILLDGGRFLSARAIGESHQGRD